MRTGAYHFEERPRDVEHRHPYLVFDAEGCLDIPVTAIVRQMCQRFVASTRRTYLHALMPFFTFVATDKWQVGAGHTLFSPPEQVQQAVFEYLVGHLHCLVKDREHFQLVSTTQETSSTTRVFLSALKAFYKAAVRLKYYTHSTNPMIDYVSLERELSERDSLNEDGSPRMPEVSGVEKPHTNRRLTNSYWKLEHEEWVPQTINDEQFPNRVLKGGRRLRGWGLREECVTLLLFEAGARISEVCGLTLGDWVKRGMTTEVDAFNKGSGSKRVKYLRFSKITAGLLRRYFDEERAALDEHNYSLNDYLRLSRSGKVDLHQVPLFLSHQCTQLSAKAYRDNYWNRACRAAGIDADVHQARHWYVTQSIKTIYQNTRTEVERQIEIEKLIKYMHWADGERTMQSYLHLWQASDHARVQDKVHKSIRRILAEEPGKPRRGRPRKSPGTSVLNQPSASVTAYGGPAAEEADTHIEFLLRLGGGDRDGNR